MVSGTSTPEYHKNAPHVTLTSSTYGTGVGVGVGDAPTDCVPDTVRVGCPDGVWVSEGDCVGEAVTVWLREPERLGVGEVDAVNVPLAVDDRLAVREAVAVALNVVVWLCVRVIVGL